MWADASLKEQARGRGIDVSGTRIEVCACIVSISPVPKSEGPGHPPKTGLSGAVLSQVPKSEAPGAPIFSG